MEHLFMDYQPIIGIAPTSGNAARTGDWVSLSNAIDFYAVSSFRRPTAGACKVEVEYGESYAGVNNSTLTSGRTVWSQADMSASEYIAVRTSSSASYTLPSATGLGIVITHVNPSALNASTPYIRVTHGTMGTANDGETCMYYLRSRYPQARHITATTSST